MKLLLYTLMASFGFVLASHAQSDSLNAIEKQQQELRLQQLRLQAKQDSLQKEQDRISAEKLRQQQSQLPSQTVTPVVQEEEHYNHTVIALHPLFAVFGQVDFSIEQRISKTSSLYLEMGYHDFNLREQTFVAAFMPGDWIAYTGYRAELQYRYYVLPETRALYKLYLAPHVYFKQDEITRGEGQELNNTNGQRRQYEYYNQYLAQSMGVGVNLGYQFQFLRHLTFDTNVGTSYTIPLTNRELSERGHLPLLNPYKEGMMLRMNLSIGFAF